MFFAFETLVDLERRLPDQKHATDDQNEIAAGNILREKGEERPRQPDDPGNREQQRDPHRHGREQTCSPGTPLLGRWEFSRENRNEDDVVDAENDFEKSEGDECEQALRREECFHHQNLSFLYGLGRQYK
jgi:hypothetical protein